jgi:hypothetical protein
MRHAIPTSVGVDANGLLDRESGAKGPARFDMSNMRDWFSPVATFEPATRGWSMLMSPFVNIVGIQDIGGNDEAVSILEYVAYMLLTFVGSFLLTLIMLGGRYIMGFSNGFSDASLAQTAIYLALLYSIIWYGIVYAWPFDRRIIPTLNPALEVVRLMTGDNTGIIATCVAVGTQFAGAALAGYSIFWLNWHQFGAACVPVAGIPAGCTVINEALKTSTSFGASAYALDWLFTALICAAFILPRKFVQLDQSANHNWSVSCISTAAVTFAVTLFGVPLGFLWFNPATYLGAIAATGTTDVNLADGLLDSLAFILFRILAAPAMAAAVYYGLRLVHWLGRRYQYKSLPFPSNYDSLTRPGSKSQYRGNLNPSMSGVMASAEPISSSMSSSSLRKRQSPADASPINSELRAPLLVEY